MLRRGSARVEDVAVIGLALAVTVYLEWRILFGRLVFQSDALIHTWWMRRFQDGGLFQDALTKAYIKAGYVPLGVQAIYYAASPLVDPARLGAFGVLVTAPLSAWLVFRIVREHTDWRPAGWLGAALFILPWNQQQFAGTHARAFGQPVVLATVYLVMRERPRWAALIPPAGALLYPPAGLIALGVLGVSAILPPGRRRLVDPERLVVAAASTLATLVALYFPRVSGLQDPRLISESAARRYPEFSAAGQMHFFTDSVLSYLRGPYSGLGLGISGSILLLTMAFVLIVRPSNALLVRREVWSLGAISLAVYAFSFAVLFRLYLPNRYAHALVGVYCIVIAVCWQPTWATLARRLRAAPLLAAVAMGLPVLAVWLAAREFPLGGQLGPADYRAWLGAGLWPAWWWIAPAVAILAAAWALGRWYGPGVAAIAAALLCAVLVAGALEVAGGGQDQGIPCGRSPVLTYLGTLPKDAVIAGDPISMDCVPIVTKRPVLISRKLYQVYDVNVLNLARPRMLASIRAYYGGSRRAIAALHTRYGADYLFVNRALITRGERQLFYNGMAPFKQLVVRLLKTTRHPAALSLPARCATWRRGDLVVYDLRCVSASVSATTS